jgi:hypothetical protein
MANEGFLFRDYYYEAIRQLPDAYRLAVYDAIMEYAFNGTIQEEPLYAYAAVVLLKDQIDKDKEINNVRDK